MTTDTELRDLLAKATPGPWSAEALGSEGFAVLAEPPIDSGRRLRIRVARCGWEEWDTDKANTALIAAAVNALPGLLDRLDEQGRQIKLRFHMAAAHRERTADAIRRADAAEAELRELRDRLIGLSEVWSQYPGPALSCATDVRALLDTPAPTPGHCTCGQPGCSDGGA